MSVDERRLKTASRMAAAILRLGRLRHVLLAVGRDDPDLVVGGLEADAGAADVVNDDRVEFLARELVAPVRERALAVLGGEADEQLAGRGGARRAKRARPQYGRAQVQFPAGLILLELARVRVLPAGSRRRRRPSAARRTRRSARRRRRRARRRSARRRIRCPPGAASDTFAATTVTLAPRRWASSASANPIRPDERLPTKRTASIGSRVPPAVTSTFSPSSCAAALQRGLDRGQQLRRLGQPADPELPRRAERARSPARARSRRARAASRGSPASPDARTSRCSWPERRSAVAGRRARPRSAGCRRAPCASLASVCAVAGATRYASACSTSARCESGACSGSGSPGKTPRSGSGSHSVTSTGAPVMPANDAGPTKRVAASVWTTRTLWPAFRRGG